MEYAITAEEFERFRTLIYNESGISLTEQKQTLVASACLNACAIWPLHTFSEYYESVTERSNSRRVHAHAGSDLNKFSRIIFGSRNILSFSVTEFFPNWRPKNVSASGRPPARRVKNPIRLP